MSEKADSLSFTHLANSIPWVVPKEHSEYDLKWGPSSPATLGYDLTKAGHKLSNERFRVAGLAPGMYELKIDGKSVGKYSHVTLGGKIELQSNPATPQYQQAMDVAILNRERNDKAVRPMRDQWGRIKGLRRKNDPEKFAEEYPKLLEKIRELRELAKDYENRIRKAAQPQPRKYGTQQG